jgi:hypothetical protein
MARGARGRLPRACSFRWSIRQFLWRTFVELRRRWDPIARRAARHHRPPQPGAPHWTAFYSTKVRHQQLSGWNSLPLPISQSTRQFLTFRSSNLTLGFLHVATRARCQNYEQNQHFQDRWATLLPWAEAVVGGDGRVSQVCYKVCSHVEG